MGRGSERGRGYRMHGAMRAGQPLAGRVHMWAGLGEGVGFYWGRGLREGAGPVGIG